MGAALEIAERLGVAGRPGLSATLHNAASGAFFHGFRAGVLVAAGLAVAGVILAGLWLPAQPTQPTEDARPAPATASDEPVLVSMLICLARCQSAEASVLEYEVAGDGARALRRFYAAAFGWDSEPAGFDHDLVVPHGHRVIRGSERAAGLLERVLAGEGERPGGGDPSAAFYVEVPDLERALETVERLGGHRVTGPVAAPGGCGLAVFRDPAGHLVGLFRPPPAGSPDRGGD